MRLSFALALVALSPLLLSSSSKPKKTDDPDPPAQYILDYNAGIKAQKNKDYEGAITLYQKALDQKSNFPDAWNNLGYCNRMIAKSYLAKSGDAYGQAIRYQSNNEYALEYQGEYFLMVGQVRKAYQNYQKLQQMNSTETGALKDKLDDTLNQAQDVLKVYKP